MKRRASFSSPTCIGLFALALGDHQKVGEEEEEERVFGNALAEGEFGVQVPPDETRQFALFHQPPGQKI